MRIINPGNCKTDGSWTSRPQIPENVCPSAIRHVYCVALVWAPRHIVKYACVARTARASIDPKTGVVKAARAGNVRVTAVAAITFKDGLKQVLTRAAKIKATDE